MSNASTVRRQVGGTQQLTLASLLGTTITTTQTPFSLNNNALTGTGGGVIPLQAGNTGLFAGTGQVLHIAFTGTLTGATSTTTTLLLELFQVPAAIIAAGTQATLSNDNAVAATSAKAITGTQASYSFDARLQLDNAGNLDGSFTSQIDSASITSPVATTQVTGLVGEADLNFIMAATLGGAETGVVLIPGEFRIDLE
jgi:hypothetical protein